VGLPGDTLRIRNGNLYLVNDQGEEILRKAPDKQKALQIPVHHNDYPAHDLLKKGWPERWASVTESANGGLAGWQETADGWQADAQARTYQLVKIQKDLAWLRYRHYFPMPSDWTAAEQNRPLDPHPRLVGDFCGYNATIGDHLADAESASEVDFGPFWDPDLTINFEIEIGEVSDAAELLVELCEGTSWYRCRIHPQSGEAVLEEVDSQLNQRVHDLGKGNTDVHGPGSYRIAFANVDDRLCLWVNGRLVDFGKGAELASKGATGNSFPTNRDLTPVGIAARGMTAMVSHLVLERDIYYRIGNPGRDYRYLGNELIRYIHDPEAWGEFYQRHSEELGQRTIEVPEGHFIAFGDNSPQSNDSRMWDLGQETVPRNYLVGKAFWIYWPHGVPFLNEGRGYPVTYHHTYDEHTGRLERVGDYPRYSVPFYPQFGRMKRIR
jgi:signal peptidase I